MKTNPYAEMLGVIQEAGGAGAPQGTLHPLLGHVRSVSPLRVEVGGTVQEAERFYIADRLLKGHRETVSPSGSLAIGASCPMGSHSSASIGGGTLTVETAAPVLQAGDLVLLLTEDSQLFYLIDKVVHL